MWIRILSSIVDKSPHECAKRTSEGYYQHECNFLFIIHISMIQCISRGNAIVNGKTHSFTSFK